jgi:outer membrane murein-binding lipoprotein Lpp
MLFRMSARFGWSLLFLGLTVGVTGCGEQKKVKECNSFVSAVNAGVDRVTKTINTVPDSGAAVNELRSLADEMEAISAETKKVQISLPDLQKISERYQTMVGDIAAAARELAVAVDSVDRENMTKAQGTLDQAVKREGPLVEDLNKYCQTP